MVTKNIGNATATNNGDYYTTEMYVNDHRFIIDEPVELGGGDAGASPMDHLCAALASCKVITLRMYAKRKGWNLETINVSVNLLRDKETAIGGYSFYCELSVAGTLTDEQKKRLLDISKACPVQRLLMKQSTVETVLTHSII